MTDWQRSANPWRQGHLLDNDAITRLGICRAEQLYQTVVMVISQDCDLTQSPMQEPLVEIVKGRIIEKEDGNNTNAKTARKLHLLVESDDGQLWVEFIATDKSAVDKQLLCTFTPRTNACLTPENLATLQRWLASRYRRSAFPDQFEQRLRDAKLHTKISKLAKTYGTHLSGVFFDVDEGDEISRQEPDDTYLLDITILYTTAPDPEKAETDATTMAQEIKNAFEIALLKQLGKWQQIELRYCDAISEAALTYEMFRQLKKWHLDHLSLAEVPQLPMVE